MTDYNTRNRRQVLHKAIQLKQIVSLAPDRQKQMQQSASLENAVLQCNTKDVSCGVYDTPEDMLKSILC